MTPARFVLFPQPLPYAAAAALQDRLVARRIADDIPDTLLLLQHPPVITLGRRGRREHLLADEERMRNAGVEVHLSSRGGDVTFHGPGQWVLYPILKLGPREMGTHGYLHALEDIALGTASAFGIDAFRKEGKAGAWCARGKFAATGFKFTRWVTQHGLSLNVCPDLRFFDLIVGCGLVGERVSSFAEVLGDRCPSMEAVSTELQRQSARVLDRAFTVWPPERLDEGPRRA
jgi:lipoyl(octanoyl) transferase